MEIAQERSSVHSAREVWKSHHFNDGFSNYGGSRDLLGYGAIPPAPIWPKDGKVALSFVINLAGGGESCLLHGDKGYSEIEGKRLVDVESLYEYGPRSGFWRLHRLFTQEKIPVTVFAVGMALERNPEICEAIKSTTSPEWEVASRGYRGIDYNDVDELVEREHIKRTIAIHERMLGKRPVGFCQGNPGPNTRRLIVGEGGFKYDSDSYADDLPYWNMLYGQQPHLIIPSTVSESDRSDSAAHFKTDHDFCLHLKNTLRYLIEESFDGMPKMMTVELNCMNARPSRMPGLLEFIDFAKGLGRQVWFCTREEIADFWIESHPPDNKSRVKSVQSFREIVSEGDTRSYSAPAKPKRHVSQTFSISDGSCGIYSREIIANDNFSDEISVMTWQSEATGYSQASMPLSSDTPRNWGVQGASRQPPTCPRRQIQDNSSVGASINSRGASIRSKVSASVGARGSRNAKRLPNGVGSLKPPSSSRNTCDASVVSGNTFLMDSSFSGMSHDDIEEEEDEEETEEEDTDGEDIELESDTDEEDDEVRFDASEQFPEYIINPTEANRKPNGSKMKGFTVWCSNGYYPEGWMRYMEKAKKEFDTTWKTKADANMRARYLFIWKNCWGLSTQELLDGEIQESEEEGLKQFYADLRDTDFWTVEVVPDTAFKGLSGATLCRHNHDESS